MPGSNSVATWKIYTQKNMQVQRKPMISRRKARYGSNTRSNNGSDGSASSRSRTGYESEASMAYITNMNQNQEHELTEKQKQTIRVIRKIKYFVAKRNFAVCFLGPFRLKKFQI